MIIAAITIVSFVLVAIAAERMGRELSRRRYREAASTVHIGDLWERLNSERPEHDGCWEVTQPNNSRESPESFVMTRFQGKSSTIYMHRSARLRGDWALRLRDGKPIIGSELFAIEVSR